MNFALRLAARREIIIVSAVAFLATGMRFLFWWKTDRNWEDGLITVLHAENLWRGLGLTHVRPDHLHVHGFTSPIGVIVPILGGAIDLHGTYALPFLKVVSALCGGVTILVIYFLVRAVPVESKWPWLIAALGYAGFEHHQILWGMAGMESQMACLILFYLFYTCAVRSPIQIGVAMSLAVYARPDFAFIDAAALAYCWLVLRKDVARIFMVAAAMYLPWLIFTTLYYGSPIPNTILAKLYGYPMSGRPHLIRLLHILTPLGPSFAGEGGFYNEIWGYPEIQSIVVGLFFVGAYFVIRDRVGQMAVPILFVLLYVPYYFFLVPGIYGWYLVPLSAAIVFIAGYGLVRINPVPTIALVLVATYVLVYLPFHLFHAPGSREKAFYAAIILLGVFTIVHWLPLSWLRFAAATAYVVIFLSLLPTTIRAERDIQRYIEGGVRMKVGLFLGSVVRDNEYAGVESLGYSSYFSRKPIVDYPGLANPDVVRFLKEHRGAGMCAVLRQFRPAYIVLRPNECRQDSELMAQYTKVRDFDAPQEAEQIFQIQWSADRHFSAFRRNDLP